MNNIPLTILQAAKLFSNPQTCEKIMLQSRWTDGKTVCPDCGSDRIGHISTRKMLRCKECRKQFGLKYGTLFEDSALELGQWFLCFFAIYHSPKLTCEQLSELLGVTLRTAWQMRRKLVAAQSLSVRADCFRDALKQIISLPKSDILGQLKPPKPHQKYR